MTMMMTVNLTRRKPLCTACLRSKIGAHINKWMRFFSEKVLYISIERIQ